LGEKKAGVGRWTVCTADLKMVTSDLVLAHLAPVYCGPLKQPGI
jgi:hypothetical protein